MENEPSITEIEYPSLKLSYEMAMKAYDVSLKRIDYWSDSIEKTLNWGTAIGVLILGRSWAQIHEHGLPNSALVTFIIGTGFLIWAILLKWVGREHEAELKALPMPPDALLEKWAILSQEEFLTYSIRNAERHVRRNSEIRARLEATSRRMFILFNLATIFGIITYLTTI